MKRETSTFFQLFSLTPIFAFQYSLESEEDVKIRINPADFTKNVVKEKSKEEIFMRISRNLKKNY